MKEQHLLFWEKGIALIGLCLFFLSFSGLMSYAASKPINSIHVQIYSKLESGDTPPDILIDKGEIQKHEVTVREKLSFYHYFCRVGRTKQVQSEGGRGT